MFLNGAFLALVFAVAVANCFTRVSIDFSNWTSPKMFAPADCGFQNAPLDVSRIKLGCPKYFSSCLNPNFAPSRDEYTPAANTDKPPTNMVICCGFESNSVAPLPKYTIPSCTTLIAFVVSASTFANICLRITSSFCRFSNVLPSASAIAFARMFSCSNLALNSSVALFSI